MINAACDIDVYALWAAALVGRDLSNFTCQRKFHTAHAGRRTNRRYSIPARDLRSQLADTLVTERKVPQAFADTMGDAMFLLRHHDLAQLKSAIADVQRLAVD